LFILSYIYLIYCEQIKKNQIIIKQYIDNLKIIKDLKYKYFYFINIFTIFIAKSSIVKSITFNFNIIVVLTKNIELKNNIKIIFVAIKIVFIVVIIVANIKLKNNFKVVSIAIVITINNFKKQIVKKKIIIKKDNNKKIIKKKTIVITIIS